MNTIHFLAVDCDQDIQFSCQEKCIPKKQRCDGVQQCNGAEDEFDCGKH